MTTRISPWDARFPNVHPASDSRTFDLAGESLELTFQPLDELALYQIHERVNAWSEQYLTGDGTSAPLPLMSPDGKRIRVSRPLFQQVATVMAMDQAPDGERWGLLEWVGLIVKFPAVWADVQDWAGGINSARSAVGNDLAQSSPTP